MNLTKQNSEYIEWLDKLKSIIKKTQIKVTLSANTELLQLYWDIGMDLFNTLNNKKAFQKREVILSG